MRYAVAAFIGAILLSAAEASAAEKYTDAVAYCAAIRTGEPDARYVGPEIPRAVKRVFPEDYPTYWRCYKGKLLACQASNDPSMCEPKDARRIPSELMIQFCREEPNAEIIPRAAAGSDSIHAWSCRRGKPRISGTFIKVDESGYPSNIDIWVRVRG